MARENLVLLHGQIQATPKIYMSTEGELTRAITAVKVLRRPYLTVSGDVVGGKLYVDCPIIMTGNKELIAQIKEMEKGDMVDIRGVITTREVVKSTLCQSCGHKNSVQGNSVYVTPIYICRREQKLDSVAGFELLKQRNEISNLAILIGTLCRAPQVYTDQDRAVTQFQIAVNRKIYLRDNKDSARTDYPWIKSYGKQAKQDSLRLQEGASVYVCGGIQTREIARAFTCEKCGAKYSWKDMAVEIIPYSVEYLLGCLFPEREDPEKRGEKLEEKKE